jgi:hypothetical protein
MKDVIVATWFAKCLDSDTGRHREGAACAVGAGDLGAANEVLGIHGLGPVRAGCQDGARETRVGLEIKRDDRRES